MLLRQSSGHALLGVLTLVSAISLMSVVSIFRQGLGVQEISRAKRSNDVKELQFEADLVLKTRCSKVVQTGRWHLSGLQNEGKPRQQRDFRADVRGPVKVLLGGEDWLAPGQFPADQRVDSVALTQFVFNGRMQGSTNYCIDANLSVVLAQPGKPALHNIPVTLDFPIRFAVSDKNWQMVSCTYDQIPPCTSEVFPRIPPLPPPPPAPTCNPKLPAYFRHVEVLPNPLPLGQKVTINWEINCMEHLYFIDEHEKHTEIPLNPPIHFPPPSGPQGYHFLATQGDEKYPNMAYAFPGKPCQVPGASCENDNCCSGFCSATTLQCADACTSHGMTKVRQAMCITANRSGEDTTCGLIPEPLNTLVKGQVIEQKPNEQYAVTWFECR